jgi:hypothetical protein
MSEPLYKLIHDYQLALEFLTYSVDDITPEIIEDSLSGMAGDIETKAKSVAAYFLNLDAEANAIKNAEAKMAARRKAIENHSQRLKDYLKQNMLKCGISRIDSPQFSLRVQKTAGAVIIDDVLAIPEGFKEIIETTHIDKTGLKLAIKSEGGVPGAHIQENYSLIIK